MRRCGIVVATVFAAAALTVGAANPATRKGKVIELYVASDGSDHWSGRLAGPNGTRTDGPFATLERVRDALRTVRRTTGISEGCTISLRAGTYRLDRTLELDAEDGGTTAAPVMYRAYRNESVRIEGGRTVKGWQPVRDVSVL